LAGWKIRLEIFLNPLLRFQPRKEALYKKARDIVNDDAEDIVVLKYKADQDMLLILNLVSSCIMLVVLSLFYDLGLKKLHCNHIACSQLYRSTSHNFRHYGPQTHGCLLCPSKQQASLRAHDLAQSRELVGVGGTVLERRVSWL